MYNWNLPRETARKQPIIWKLNQMINFGLAGEKLNASLVKKYWDKLDLDPKRKVFLHFLLWGKLS